MSRLISVKQLNGALICCLLGTVRWHMSHDLQYRLTSDVIPGRYNSAVTLFTVRLVARPKGSRRFGRIIL
jgi:UV DNA damage repair endonuclease